MFHFQHNRVLLSSLSRRIFGWFGQPSSSSSTDSTSSTDAALGSTDSSSSRFRWTGDVFLNFRGEDTRNGFTGHLYAALSNAGISTFRDSEELQKGDEISSLFSAIKGAKVSIVVFSETYAESTWCLDELVKIMERRASDGQTVIPIFYHIQPSEVRSPHSFYAKAIRMFEKRFPPKRISAWRNALTEASNISGFHIEHFGSEAEHIQRIVKDVSRMLDNDYLTIADYPVGIESRVQKMLQLIRIRSPNVRVIGIWGMGDIGKTTIAKAIYNEICHKFEGKCFLSNVKDAWRQFNGGVHLQEHLLSSMLKTRKIKIMNVDRGKEILQERLHRKRLLLVLDDVDDLEQIKALCGDRSWFGECSIIIITTRDVNVLKFLKADKVCKPKQMDRDESHELFVWHAFKQQNIPDERFIALSREAVDYCGGLPLALQVIGSYLFNRDTAEWKSTLRKLKRIPNNQIQMKLKISFDGLEDDFMKDIFLDISCFCIGMDKNDVVQILDGCGLFASIGLRVLEERCLVTVDRKNKLTMHDLLRDMGREIIREKSPKEPEKRTRLWLSEDVLEVLKEYTGTKAIEGIALKDLEEVVDIHVKAFEKMKKLRLLQLSHVQLTGDYGYLSKEMRWLNWRGFPLSYIPSNLYQGHLVSVDLRYSNLRILWKEPQLLENLKAINLSHSQYLIQTPDFSKLPNLEKLILKNCSNLREVHKTIGHLRSLVYLNIKGCTSLRHLPRSLYKLQSLEIFILSSCPLIDALEEDVEQMLSLTTLDAHDTPIKKVPFSIVKSRSLKFISLCGYEGSAPELFPRLIWSWMSPRDSSQTIARSSKCLSEFSCLWRNSFLSGLSEMSGPWLEHRPHLHQIRDLAQALNLDATNLQNPYTFFKTLAFHMGSCSNITTSVLTESFLQGCNNSLSSDFIFTTDAYGGCFTYKDHGPSLCFEVPPVVGPTLKGVTLWSAFSSSLDEMQPDHLVCVINHTKGSIQIAKLLTSKEETCNESKTWKNMLSNVESGDRIEIIVDFRLGFTVTMLEVRLFYSMAKQLTNGVIGHSAQLF